MFVVTRTWDPILEMSLGSICNLSLGANLHMSLGGQICNEFGGLEVSSEPIVGWF
jgi:hypothetical protein